MSIYLACVQGLAKGCNKHIASFLKFIVVSKQVGTCQWKLMLWADQYFLVSAVTVPLFCACSTSTDVHAVAVLHNDEMIFRWATVGHVLLWWASTSSLNYLIADFYNQNSNGTVYAYMHTYFHMYVRTYLHTQNITQHTHAYTYHQQTVWL